MNSTLKFIAVSAIATGVLLAATPALAYGGSGKSGNGFFGAFLNLPLMHVGVNAGTYKNYDYKPATSTASTTPFVKPFPAAVEIGTVSSVNGTSVTLAPAIHLNGTSTAATSVVTTASTTFKGGATSTASLSSGENVLIIGTTSTSTPGTITAFIVIALENIGHFCSHLFR